MTKKEIRLRNELRHGEKIAKNAEEVWNWESGAGRIRADKRAKLLADALQLSDNDQVLEVGCGTGLFTDKVSSLSGTTNIDATDLSPALIEVAKKKYPHLSFRVDDAMGLDVDSESLDALFGNSIIHHLDLNAFSSELFRVLKPGGRFSFAEPNMLNPQIFIQKNVGFIKEWLGDSPDESAINRFTFKKLLESKGFKDIRIKPFDFLHPAVPKLLIPVVNGISNALDKTPFVREIGGSVLIYGKK